MDRAQDFSNRAEKCTNPLLKKLFRIIVDKQTNLCLAADALSFETTVKLVEKVGPHICMLKIHSEQFGGSLPHDMLMERLNFLKKEHNFLLFEDRKFFDGGKTVQLSYEALCAKHADIVTVVPDLGDAMFDAIRQGAKISDEPRGCLAVCELSFANVIRPNAKELLQVAEANLDICIGVIAQQLQVSDRINMLKASPGVNLSAKVDESNQQWRAPGEVLKDGADILIVGRGITKAPEDQWESVAERYKEFCWGKTS